jgi:uncharacterized protein (DUF433 family)
LITNKWDLTLRPKSSSINRPSIPVGVGAGDVAGFQGDKPARDRPHGPVIDRISSRRELAREMREGYSSRMSEGELLNRITLDPGICHGKPCVRGLRYPVETLLELLSGGMTEQQILEDYPDLEAADIRAIHAYAARLSRVKVVEPAS